MSLSARHQRFVAEYLIDLNASAAYRRAYPDAGYESSKRSSSELMTIPDVQDAIREAQAERAQRTAISQDRVLLELARLAFFDVRKLLDADGVPKPLNELDDDSAAAIAGLDVVEEREHGQDGRETTTRVFTKKYRIADKNAALTNAMRHLGMLKDRIEHTGKDGGPIQAEETPAMVAMRIAFTVALGYAEAKKGSQSTVEGSAHVPKA